MLEDPKQILAILDSRALWILDGAIGTELERRGYQTKLPLWTSPANIERPELVAAIHHDYLEAGASIITANTFRSTYYTYEKGGYSHQEAEDACMAAIRIALSQVSGRDVLIAASLAPLEDCYRPQDTPADEVLQEFHSRQLHLLGQSDADLILAETINTRSEARIIAKSCHQLSLPFMISLITDGKGLLLSGESMIEVIKAISRYDPLAIMLNCRPAKWITRDMSILKEHATGLIGGYANAPGSPDSDGNWTRGNDDIAGYLSQTHKWRAKGARIVGGCCGTTPEYIKKISSDLLPQD